MDRFSPRALTAALACAAVAGLALPERGHGYALSGDVLDLTQRHFRVLANFTAPEANDDLTPDPDFPGSLGAELAIRKGVAEWGSRPHGTGGSDPSQAVLGSGGANFDSLFSGRATVPGGTNGNTISVIQIPASILAFTEIPSGDGWRIRFYDGPRTWNDGPGVVLDGPDPMDIQGIACHEYGHALGLQHTTVLEATMAAGIPADDAISHRSLHADDIAGVQAIYGPASTTKPVITGSEWIGPRLVLHGSGFHPTDNELWFTQAQVPALRKPLRRGGVPALASGTRLEVVPPPGAGIGDVLVHVPGSAHDTLSNAWPFAPGVPHGWTPPAHYGTSGSSSTGSFELSWESLPSVSTGMLEVRWTGAGPSTPVIVFGGMAPGSILIQPGVLLVQGPLQRFALAQSDSAGSGTADVPFQGSVGTQLYLQAWSLDPAVGAGAALSNGLELELTP